MTPGAKTIVAGAGGVSVKSAAAAESSVTVTIAVAVSVSAPARVNVRVVLVPSATLAVAAANATLAALPSSARISATLGDSSWITRSRTVLFGAVSCSAMVSSDSRAASALTFTTKVCWATPGGKVRVPVGRHEIGGGRGAADRLEADGHRALQVATSPDGDGRLAAFRHGEDRLE